MAKEDIVEYQFDNRTAEEQHEIAVMGGTASGEARREKASLKKAVQMLLNSNLDEIKAKDFSEQSLAQFFRLKGFDINKLPPATMAAIGLWLGAIEGNATNFKTLGEYNLEGVEESMSSTPVVKIEISDNSKLEGVLYEANRPDSNDDK